MGERRTRIRGRDSGESLKFRGERICSAGEQGHGRRKKKKKEKFRLLRSADRYLPFRNERKRLALVRSLFDLVPRFPTL